ncbi:Similar to S.cerevisiae protein HSL7 (Protein arginine N-methyltransferase) [Malassezia sympodialis ATCC 42132]|uniref:Similar to S.cerevisiae protein HSL7 (Protein arginine N-methyltransferase) n=1 Tax=Malassezia sympodialis (strain ATCC 42132) TaxID=1230383 RepID=A0A1M8A702_MALS4|nr:Similar to S.cerevisiae protein HSL7 (Protein arginine N-methyltransferase) [Malassezia sympodialis ATCC 42132]
MPAGTDDACATKSSVRVALFIPTNSLGLASSSFSRSFSALLPRHGDPTGPAVHQQISPTPEAIGVSIKEGEAVQDILRDTKLSPVTKAKSLAQAGGYDDIVLEMTNARWRERWERLCLRSVTADPEASTTMIRSTSRAVLPEPSEAGDLRMRVEAEEWRAQPQFHRAELNVSGSNEIKEVTLVLSQWLELDSVDEGIRFDSEIALRQEMEYAAYLGATQVILPSPSSDPERLPYLADYARAIRSCLQVAGPLMKLAVRLPVSSPHILATMLKRQNLQASNGTMAMPAAAYLRTNDNWAWETWEVLQNLCGYHTQLCIALDMSMPLPPSSSMIHWVSEPVSILWLPSSSFLANGKGYPVLSKSAQSLVQQLVQHAPRIILSDITTPPPQHSRGGPSAYLQYIRYLTKQKAPTTKLDAFAQGYHDWLQAPLQPMEQNLAADVYSMFESDPVKYNLYEEAMYQALSQHGTAGTTMNVWIVGAGHGALVDRCLAAAERASRLVHITALEKNPGACVSLQSRQVTEWGSERVRVLQGDMRTLSVPASMSDRADVVVSELLGSFGDNELAPECLDGAMRFLKPHGISIPSSYIPYIAPITTPKLHASIKAQDTHPHAKWIGMGMPATSAKFDEPFVVMFKSMNLLSDLDEACKWPRVQPCWRFEHTPMDNSGLVCDTNGLPLSNNHNVRSSVNTFFIPHAGVCHGLAGYFEAHLFGNVVLSIFPDKMRASPNMVSWFPMFFPFREPLYLPGNAELDVHIWRLTDKHRVWYEWCAEVFLKLGLTRPVTPESGGETPRASDDTRNLSASDMLPPFVNAQHTPMMPSDALPGAVVQSMAGGTGTPEVPPVGLGLGMPPSSTGHDTTVLKAGVPSPQTTRRIKTGQTDLMNAGGRGSWLTIST